MTERDDGLSRRKVLECMTSAGTGVLWKIAGGVPTSLGIIDGAVAAQQDVAVKIDNFTFGPQEVRVKTGTTVTWTNSDDIPHTVVPPNNFRSKVLDTDGRYSFTFTTLGTYKYFCSLHPH
ncbi:MAG: plastocyanin/azurin family copper-binding protein, partial [Pseudolabrys sp.]